MNEFVPLGSVEPHAGLLRAPPPEQLVYKVMRTEHFLASLEGSYLHFNRVDSYRDFHGADAADGAQLPGDRPSNASSTFVKAPDFTMADYYDRSRARTYACCFALENADYIWRNYGNGGSTGKVCLVFQFGKLRELLNAPIAAQDAGILYNGVPCKQIFSINHGIIRYVDRATWRANEPHLPNPIEYTYMKDASYSRETEFRVSLSALGMGHFALADGSRIEFPPNLTFDFNYRAAIASGVITEIKHSPDCDTGLVQAALARFRIALVSTAH